MRKTVKISTEEHQRLVTAERVLTKEVKRLQDEKGDLLRMNELLREVVADHTAQLSEARSNLRMTTKAYSRLSDIRASLNLLWHKPDALMNKVSLRSRWPELYNVLDKELK